MSRCTTCHSRPDKKHFIRVSGAADSARLRSTVLSHLTPTPNQNRTARAKLSTLESCRRGNIARHTRITTTSSAHGTQSRLARSHAHTGTVRTVHTQSRRSTDTCALCSTGAHPTNCSVQKLPHGSLSFLYPMSSSARADCVIGHWPPHSRCRARSSQASQWPRARGAPYHAQPATGRPPALRFGPYPPFIAVSCISSAVRADGEADLLIGRRFVP